MKKTILGTIAMGALVAGGAVQNLRAEENAPANPPAAQTEPKTTQQQLAGKVVAVEKKARTLTLEVNGKTYVLRLDKKTKITKGATDGNPGVGQTIDDLRVGQDLLVAVSVTELPSGEMEVAVQSVETAVPEEAAGKAKGHTKGKRNGPPVPFPGHGTPNLGNSGGNVVSQN
jgi:hypothetical protein